MEDLQAPINREIAMKIIGDAEVKIPTGRSSRTRIRKNSVQKVWKKE